MIEVFIGSYFEVINIKNLLENEGVFAFIQNEYLSVLEPWTVTAGGCAPAGHSLLKTLKYRF
nr:hypothetical protein [uncultured Flavobacterium sp.]